MNNLSPKDARLLLQAYLVAGTGLPCTAPAIMSSLEKQIPLDWAGLRARMRKASSAFREFNNDAARRFGSPGRDHDQMIREAAEVVVKSNETKEPPAELPPSDAVALVRAYLMTGAPKFADWENLAVSVRVNEEPQRDAAIEAIMLDCAYQLADEYSFDWESAEMFQPSRMRSAGKEVFAATLNRAHEMEATWHKHCEPGWTSDRAVGALEMADGTGSIFDIRPGDYE